MKQALAGLRMLLVLTVLTGILYPFGVWAISRLPGLHANAEGSATLIGIDPVVANPDHDPYFHTRPSAVTDPSTSGGSNQAATNENLLTSIQQRKDAIAHRENVDPSRIPADAVTASASGLDPDISPAYAELQVPRVARENGLSEQQVRAVVEENTTNRALGFLGDPGVNVQKLNLAVQSSRKMDR